MMLHFVEGVIIFAQVDHQVLYMNQEIKSFIDIASGTNGLTGIQGKYFQKNNCSEAGDH
jgi:hypothetical protein